MRQLTIWVKKTLFLFLDPEKAPLCNRQVFLVGRGFKCMYCSLFFMHFMQHFPYHTADRPSCRTPVWMECNTRSTPKDKIWKYSQPQFSLQFQANKKSCTTTFTSRTFLTQYYDMLHEDKAMTKLLSWWRRTPLIFSSALPVLGFVYISINPHWIESCAWVSWLWFSPYHWDAPPAVI